MTIKATTTKTTTFHGRCFWPLSDQRRSYNYCTRKMNGDVRLLKRGASVAQLQSPSRFQPEPIPMLAFEELSFAENFTTSARVGLIWKFSSLEFSIALAFLQNVDWFWPNLQVLDPHKNRVKTLGWHGLGSTNMVALLSSKLPFCLINQGLNVFLKCNYLNNN